MLTQFFNLNNLVQEDLRIKRFPISFFSDHYYVMQLEVDLNG